MVTFRWAMFLLTLLCVALAFGAGVRNGLLILATVFAVAFVWSVGGFTKAFWFADAETSARLAAVDEELDRVAVLTDIESLDRHRYPRA